MPMMSTEEPPARTRKKLSKTAVGCTDFPRAAFSFKWVINYARPLLSCDWKLESPSFEVPLPDKDRGSSWHLSLQRATTRGTKQPFFKIDLLCSGAIAATSQPGVSVAHLSKCCIADCVFSVLDSKTSEKQFSKTALSTLCEISQAKCGVDNFISRDKLKEVIPSGVLTIQVAGSIIYMDPIQVAYKASTLPPHSSIDAMKKLYDEMSFSDVRIKCGEEEFQAHKAILSSQSPVFNRMFETDMKEKRDGVVSIPDIDPDVMAEMLAFIYTGNSPKIKIHAKKLLYAAYKYELTELVDLCKNELMMNLCVDNLLEVVECARTYGLDNLKMACIRMLKCNLAELLKSGAWKGTLPEDLAYELLEYHAD